MKNVYISLEVRERLLGGIFDVLKSRFLYVGYEMILMIYGKDVIIVNVKKDV